MKKHFSLISAILFLTCAQLLALSPIGVNLPEPCPYAGNYTRVEVFYAGENNAQVAVFSNSDLRPASLIISFPATAGKVDLTIVEPGGARCGCSGIW